MTSDMPQGSSSPVSIAGAVCRLGFSALLLASWPTVGYAADGLTGAFQKALFEEEVNQDLKAAVAGYQSVVEQFDAQRRVAANTVFRLAESYRKLGQTNEAKAQFERLLREFSDQTSLVTLGRQSLATLRGGIQIDEMTTTIPAEEVAEIARLKRLIRDSPDLLNRREQNPLIHASQEGQIHAVRFLIESGADVNVEERLFDTGHGLLSYTALSQAVAAGHRGIAELLLNAGAKSDVKVDAGSPLLCVAANRGYSSMIDLLLQHGADPMQADNNGFLPIHRAVGSLPAVKLLLPKYEINVRTKSGETPLLLAVGRKELSVVTFLVSQGADINARNQDGTSPLARAKLAKETEIANILVQAGARE